MEPLISFGIIFALLAALSSGIEKLVRKKIAININPMVFAFFFELIGAAFAFPLFILNFEFPQTIYAWPIIIASGILWAGVAITMTKSYKYLEASFIAPASRARIILVLIFSLIFLKETLNSTKLAGTLLVFGGLVFLSYKKGTNFAKLKEKGMIYLVLSIVIISIALIFNKFAINFFNPETYNFIIYMSASLFLFPWIISKGKESKKMIKSRFLFLIVIASVLSVLYNYFTLIAFKFAEANVIIPLTELSSLVAVFGGIILFRERKDMLKKIISTVIVVAGVILISLA